MLEQARVTQDDGSDDELVLSTVHSAKGLEFDNVMIMGCVDGVFPLTFPNTVAEDELRCFYVAITRAKNNLTLFAPEYTQRFRISSGNPRLFNCRDESADSFRMTFHLF